MNTEDVLEDVEFDFNQEEFEELDIMEITEDKVAQVSETEKELLPSLRKFQARVNLNMNSLQRLGEILPSLKELKLNDSIINSLRDLGTSLTNLEVLWVSRCQISDLSGVNYFFQLKEIYASFNNIKDISSLMFHNSLQVADFEANDISDVANIEYLQTIPNLISVNLIGNPVRDDSQYYEKMGEIKTLQKLDEKDLFGDSFDVDRSDHYDYSPDELNEFLERQPELVPLDVVEKFKKFEAKIPVNIKEIEAQAAQVFEEERKKEINDDDIITYSIKQQSRKANDDQRKAVFIDLNTSKKGEIKRPQTAMSRLNTADTLLRKTGSNFNMTSSEFNRSYVSNKTASQTMTNSFFSSNNNQNNKVFDRDLGTSSLVQGVDVAFSGNPIKALQHAKSKQNTSKVFVGPKDILKLIDEFKVVSESSSVSRRDSEKSDDKSKRNPVQENKPQTKPNMEHQLPEDKRKIKSAMGTRENKDEKKVTDMREIKERKEQDEKNHKRLLSQKIVDPQREMNLDRAKSFDKIVSKESLMQQLKKENPQKGRLNLLINKDNKESNSASGFAEGKNLGTLKLRNPIKPVITNQAPGLTARAEILQKSIMEKRGNLGRLSLKKKLTNEEKNV